MLVFRARVIATVTLLGVAAAGIMVPPRALADDGESNPRAVKVVADQRLPVANGAGKGVLPIYASANLTQALPDIKRAIVVFHGKRRNADTYFRSGMDALAAAGDAGRGTLVIAPQFLTPADVAAHHLPDTVLRWSGTDWMGGEPAAGPAGLSSYDAIDAIMAHLADRSLYPNLARIVVAGHSGGGQVVQRYAVVGHSDPVLRQAGIETIRYVIANPSSYVYFNTDRPRPDGTFAPFDAARCANFNRWKYGMEATPAYVAERGTEGLEGNYVRRDVIYLLGAKDTNPNHPALDKSCAAQAQGPHRLARGHAYFQYIQKRNLGDFNQRLHDVAGVGHEGGKMLQSACGLAALFGNARC